MFSTLNSRLLHRSFLMRLLQTTGLSLALMTASAAGVRAADVTVQGAPGANGANNGYPGDWEPGGTGGPATANANSADPLNKATAVGGDGGDGGYDPGGDGGIGGTAQATAATRITSGSAIANAIGIGGSGGIPAFNTGFGGLYANGGSGGTATATATGSSGNGSAAASASATGGSATVGQGFGAFGGDANSSSTALASGPGDALSSATATGGNGSYGIDGGRSGGSATATANASATGGGKAIATAVAIPGIGPNMFGHPGAQAVSNAETVNGAMAKALSTINIVPFGYAQPMAAESTAKTDFAGVSVQATAVFQTDFQSASSTASTEAIAQGGSGPTALDPGLLTGAISIALPDKAYATMLIGDASNVADALLGPGGEIFGTSVLESGSSTFDFSFRGDLILGVIDGDADIIVNGTELLSVDGFAEDTVFDLGSFGPNIELTITDGFGAFAIGGAVPEPSTWAMLLLGFAGLGLVGYRQTRGAKPRAA